MKVRSEIYDVELEATEYDDMTIISHNEIEKFLMEHPHIEVTTNAKILNPNMCVVEAIAKDTISCRTSPLKIGESNPSNLENKISKMYPATMAYQRAIDRAVLKLIGLEGKAYSSVEIQNVSPKEKNSISIYNQTDNNMVPTDINGILSNNTENYEEKYDEDYDVNHDEECSVEPFEDGTIILLGNCRNKSYGEVKHTPAFDKLLKWVSKTTTNYPDEERNAQLKILKDYITEKGVA